MQNKETVKKLFDANIALTSAVNELIVHEEFLNQENSLLKQDIENLKIRIEMYQNERGENLS